MNKPCQECDLLGYRTCDCLDAQEWDEMSDSKKRLVGLMMLGSTPDGGRSDA